MAGDHASIANDVAKLKKTVHTGQLSEADRLFQKIKIKLTQFNSLPPLFEPSSTAIDELVVARDALETGALLMVKLKDNQRFERNFSQLKAYYSDTRDLLQQSEMEHTLVGLNLLRLLSQNRIAEFHTELEVISPAAQETVYVKEAIMIEQWLMEGAYNKVIEARTKASNIEFASHFLDDLIITVKEELAACSSRAYNSLSTSDARRIMMLDSEDELKDLVKDEVRFFSIKHSILKSKFVDGL